MEQEIRQDLILGSRCFSNYFWAISLFIGGLGFILAGFSSYFNVNFLPFANPSELVFIPQGLVMIFYGMLSFSFSTYIFIPNSFILIIQPHAFKDLCFAAVTCLTYIHIQHDTLDRPIKEEFWGLS